MRGARGARGKFEKLEEGEEKEEKGRKVIFGRLNGALGLNVVTRGVTQLCNSLCKYDEIEKGEKR